jgi:hypothetical protein
MSGFEIGFEFEMFAAKFSTFSLAVLCQYNPQTARCLRVENSAGYVLLVLVTSAFINREKFHVLCCHLALGFLRV